MIVIETGLEKMPDNCLDCSVVHCYLAQKTRGDGIKKEYHSKRHKGCGLRVVEETGTEHV